MAGKTAILAVKIISDAKGAQQGFDKTATKVEKFKAGLNKASLVAGGALAGIVKLAKGSVSAASDLQQSVGGVDAVFGSSAAGMHKWAKSAATNFGLSENSANEFAAVLGAQLKNAGTPLDQVSAKTKNLVGLGSDLAATYGGSTSDAVEALSSALKGEMDPIEKYGISLNQAQLQVQALKTGIKGSSTTWTTAQKQQIILAALTKQSGDAQGQFAKQSNTAAEQQQIMNARLENTSAKLGTVLLPIITKAAGWLGKMAGWVQKNSTAVQIFVGVFGGLAAAILLVRAAMTAWEAATAVATAAQWAWNAAMDANPIGIIIVAIGALIAVIVLVVTHWKQVSAVAKVVWSAVVGWLKTAIKWVGTLTSGWLSKIVDWWNKIKTGARILWAAVVAGVQLLIGWLRKLVGSYIARVKNAFSTLGRVGKTIWNGTIGGIKTAISWLRNLWHSYIDRVRAAFKAVGSAGRNAFNGVVGTIRNVIGWVRSAIDWVQSLINRLGGGIISKIGGLFGFSARVTPETATYAAGPRTAAAGRLGLTALPTVNTYTINVTVNGAIDKVATGRTVVDAIDTYLRAVGKKPAAGGPKVVIA